MDVNKSVTVQVSPTPPVSKGKLRVLPNTERLPVQVVLWIATEEIDKLKLLEGTHPNVEVVASAQLGSVRDEGALEVIVNPLDKQLVGQQ